jgi:aminoglycoside phosphotransferase (APT) family kinase protein
VLELGGGTDNTAYEVDGELVVRLARDPDPGRRAEAVRREAALLAAVGRLSPIPVPEPVFADPGAGALAYRKLPGRPLDRSPVPHPERLGPALGRFLSALHRADLAELGPLAPPDDHPTVAWREDAERDHLAVAGHLPPAARRTVESFLAAPPPPDPDRAAVLCHNDLGAEHILVADGDDTLAITAVIDWTDAAATDAARDLARLFRDLGPEALDRTLAHYDGPWSSADRERAVFYARCALLEDLAHGLGPGPRRYADAALAHLPHTFADPAA